MVTPANNIKTSPKGIAFLERHEGVVLKAYRDPIGIWTIGAGLTKASGVVTPRAGMTISNAEASRLMAEALQRNYEPRVRKAMPGAQQHEFDAGASFDWNAGAIHKASWVKAWLVGDWGEAKRRLALWRKAGGRVLPGLVRRRDEEFQLLRFGDYGNGASHNPPKDYARIVVPTSAGEVALLHAAFKKLGYLPGANSGRIRTDAVRAFQRDHDLTDDGIIGRATLSTVQRRLDARSKVKAPGAVAASGGAATVAPDQIDVALPEAGGIAPELVVALGALGLVIGGLALLWVAWRYRDVIAVKVQRFSPRLAAKLRGY